MTGFLVSIRVTSVTLCGGIRYYLEEMVNDEPPLLEVKMATNPIVIESVDEMESDEPVKIDNMVKIYYKTRKTWFSL